MKITTKIKPLFEDLIVENFENFIVSTECQRFCNTMELTNLWTESYNEEKLNRSSSFFDDILEPDAKNILALFLNKLYANGEKNFLISFTALLIRFLQWTPGIPEVENILKDLYSINLSLEEAENIKREWDKLNNDLLRKAILLKELVTNRSTNMGGNPQTYIRFRTFLMNHPVTKDNMPFCIADSRTLDDLWVYMKRARATYAARREFILESFNPLFKKLDNSNPVIASAIIINEHFIQDVWNKALQRLNDDPEGAITSARTLLETVCKHILETNSISYEDTMELPKLYKLTACGLNMSPDQHTEQIFRQVLGGCQTVVEGLGSLRNKLSDSHGRSQQKIKPSGRHAALAVNLSGAMCNFLLQTSLAIKEKGKNNAGQ